MSSSAATLEEVIHLWNRAAFGIDAAGAELRVGRSWATLVAELVDAPAASMPRPAVLDDASLDEIQKSDGLAEAWLQWMVDTPTPGVEKLAYHWHGQFTTSIENAKLPLAHWNYLQTLRSKAVGDYRQLVGSAVLTASVQKFLDNTRSMVDGINENLGREFLELFTVGLGSYTQTDVVEVARSFTGYTLSADSSTVVFDPSRFDNGTKVVFGVSGNYDSNGVFDLVFAQRKRELVRHALRRLWTHLAYPNPTTQLIEAMTTAVLRGPITGAALARTVYQRKEFYSVAAKARPRTPLEHVVAQLRRTGIKAADVGARKALSEAGHQPLRPPNVSGWAAPRDLWTHAAWWAVAGVSREVADKAAERVPSLIPLTAALTPNAAGKTLLRYVGVPKPASPSVTGMAGFLSALRLSRPLREPESGLTAALLSPDFAKS